MVVTSCTRNHVCIWVVVPPKTAEKPWFCWIFAWLMIFLTIVSNGFSKKLNNDCFPRFRGWTYTERYRSGYNGPDSKSGVQKCTEGSNPSLSAKNKQTPTGVCFVFHPGGFERVGSEWPAGGRPEPTLTEPAGESESHPLRHKKSTAILIELRRIFSMTENRLK